MLYNLELEDISEVGSEYLTIRHNYFCLRRVLVTRMQLVSVIKNARSKKSENEEASSLDLPFNIKMPSMPQLQKEENATTVSAGPKLYVRDDGTVDWDGALQDRAALQQFGTAVWARINGQDPASISEEDENSNKLGGHGEKPAVTAKIEDTPDIKEARKKLNDLEKELYATETAHTKLLNSGTFEKQCFVGQRHPQIRQSVCF